LSDRGNSRSLRLAVSKKWTWYDVASWKSYQRVKAHGHRIRRRFFSFNGLYKCRSTL